MKKNNILAAFLIAIGIISCSSSQDSSNSNMSDSSDVYIFDDVGIPDTANMMDTDSSMVQDTLKETQGDEILEPVDYEYYVQVGAFTTRERADKFVEENKSKLNYNLNITFSYEVNLWVVRLPVFTTREDAEKTRNYLWNSGNFNDAFIVTLEKNAN